MTKTVKKLFSLLLCFSLVLGMFVMPVSATGAEEAATVTGDTAQAAPAEKTATAPEETTEDANSGSAAPALSFAGVEFSPETLLNLADTEVDEEDATILAVKEELKGIQVLNADGETVPLTEDEIQAVLAYFQQYLGILADNANIYGIQTPFFLSFNDSGEDGLGILGEMLVLAGYSVQDVRDGKYAFMDLVMMIKTFIYTYGLGAEYYGSAILAGQKEALQAVKDSGAKTEAQKLLVLNNWIAQNNTFDMPYIMNADSDHSGTVEKDEVIMAAPDGSSILTMQNQDGTTTEYYGANSKNANYSKVQSYVEKDLEEFFTAMFHDQIYAGVVANLRQQYYEGAIKAGYKKGVIDGMKADEEVKAAVVDGFRQEQYKKAYDEEYQKVYDEEYAKALTELEQAACEHTTTKIAWEWSEDASKATASEVCTDCKKVMASAEATVVKDEEASVAATCVKAGQDVFNATAEIDGTTYKSSKTIELPIDPDAHHFDENGECACGAKTTVPCKHTERKAEFEWEKVATGGVTVTAKILCAAEDCGEVLAENLTATPEKVATKCVAPTCSATGKDVYTATVTFEGKDYTEEHTFVLEIDPDNHSGSTGAGTDNRCDDCRPAAGEEAVVLASIEEDAAALATERTEARKAEIEKAANDAADAAVAALTDEQKTEMVNAAVDGGEGDDTDFEKQAEQLATEFMEENKDAITNDAPGFVEATFGPEAAAQIAAGCDQFVKDAEENGVEVDPVNAPGYKMTVEELTQQTMASEKIVDMDNDGTPETTANDAIPMYVQGATPGLTNATVNGWKGCHIGAFGFGTSVCLGYAMAFNYLVQSMHPEVYGVSADADMSKTENWKTRDEVYGDDLETSDYLVDTVRVTFDTDVTMYGNPSTFGEVHFWNAVKVDGKWYYVDPCYIDVYSEVMSRDRAQTDGNMNHLYFMFSHDSARSMYDGYTNTNFGDDQSGIAGLYSSKANHKDYEDSWMSRINCTPYFSSDGYVYYIYDSTDLLSLMEDSQNNFEDTEEASVYKLVRHKLTTTDAGDNGDSDYETLIVFNAENDDGTTEARVYDAEAQETVRHEFLTEMANRHFEYADTYPSVEITCALYNGIVYFNLANCILSIDLETYEVALVKEYNTVYGVRDDSEDFGGRAFSVTTENNADFTVENHPIAAITLNGDDLIVSIATNFALISGKANRTNPAIEVNGEDNGYGYEYEESNFNKKYNSYYNDAGAQYGMEKEVNDNDEFMWSANFVETLSVSHLAGSSHNYEEVTVAPFCGIDGYTENRCTTCGASEADSRVVDEGTACEEHHFVKFDEIYYTKDDGGSWNRGTSYVCAVCSYAVAKPSKPRDNAEQEELDQYEKDLAEYEAAAASAGHIYEPTDAEWTEDSTSVTFKELECANVCPERKAVLDCLLDDDTINVTLTETVTAEASLQEYVGECTTGVTAVYSVSGEAEGYKYVATNLVELEAGNHAYEAEFTWTEVTDEETGEVTGYTAVADVKCPICGDAHEGVEAEVTYDEENSAAATCTENGKDAYVAVVTIKDEEDQTIGTATGTKVIDLPALGHTMGEDCVDNEDGATHTGTCTVCGELVEDDPHNFVDGICEDCGAIALVAPELLSIFSREQTSCKATWTLVDHAEGYELWRTTTPDDEDSWTRVKTVKDGSKDVYTNQGLTVGTTYYYKVRAYIGEEEASRVYSDFSEVKYMPAAVLFDGPYSNATFRIRLRWKEIGGADGYQIWRLNDDDTWSLVKTLGDRGNTLTNDQGATTAYSNTGLEAGKQYTYKMRAFAIPEEGVKVFGAYSDEFTVAVMPETPKTTVTSTKAGRAELSWNAVNGAAGYQIWMAESQNGEYKIIKSVTDGSTAYNKTGLSSGKTYFFKVRAYVEVNGKKTFGAYTDILNVRVR